MQIDATELKKGREKTEEVKIFSISGGRGEKEQRHLKN